MCHVSWDAEHLCLKGVKDGELVAFSREQTVCWRSRFGGGFCIGLCGNERKEHQLRIL